MIAHSSDLRSYDPRRKMVLYQEIRNYNTSDVGDLLEQFKGTMQANCYASFG